MWKVFVVYEIHITSQRRVREEFESGSVKLTSFQKTLDIKIIKTQFKIKWANQVVFRCIKTAKNRDVPCYECLGSIVSEFLTSDSCAYYL